jgi:hypothetical protein
VSPVSRGRKTNKSHGSRRDHDHHRRITPPAAHPGPDPAETDPTPEELVDALITNASGLPTTDDPLDVELVGTLYAGMHAIGGDVFGTTMIEIMIPLFGLRADRKALAILLAIGSVARASVRDAAQAAADRLLAAGIPAPTWAAELAEPVTATDFRQVMTVGVRPVLLYCTFHRASRAHAIVLFVDPGGCGAAINIVVLDPAKIPDLAEMLMTEFDDPRTHPRTEPADPADFRWQVENALAARDLHDRKDIDPSTYDLLGPRDVPTYPALAELLRRRMTTLPQPGRPPQPHDNGCRVRRLGSDTPAATPPAATPRAATPQPRHDGGPSTETVELRAQEGRTR